MAARRVYGSLTDPRYTTAGLMYTMDGILRDPSLARQKARRESNNMRKDPQVQAPFMRRKMATMGLKWAIVPEDEDDDGQNEAATIIENDIRGFDYEELMENLLEALWYGPGPAEHVVEYDERDRRFRVMGTRSIHGDSVVFDWDGEPYLRVGPGYRGPGVVTGYESPARKMTPAEREVFILHKYNPGAPEYFTPEESANIFHGIGLREDVFYPWWIKHQIHKDWVGFLERFAQGILVIMHPDTEAGQDAAEKAVQDYKAGNFILMPIHADSIEIKKMDVRVVEAPSNTAGLFREYVEEFIGGMIKNVIEGQVLTSAAAPTGLGSGVAAAHQDTFQMLIRYDANRLSRTLTEQLVWRLQRWNGIIPDVRLRWEFSIDDPSPEERLKAIETAHRMGVTFREDDIRDLTGMSKPNETDDIIGGVAMDQPSGPPGTQRTFDFGADDAGGNGRMQRLQGLLS